MTTYWHIASSKYEAGADLLCWNTLEARGIVTDADWKWDTAEVGSDGHLVSLANSLDEIDWLLDEIEDGQILRVDIPDEALTDDAELDWDDKDEDRVYLTHIREGRSIITAAMVRIPGKYITVVC
jgi:hypothetical protein